jgi:formylglycine-generating enzyme required for sulfatase activity
MEERTLGDYKIIKSIGQGTLGSVYLAEHRFMKRQYVLKVLPEELSSDRGFIQRFEEDIGILASLDHPNIVKIYNISFAQGQYFLVTDCIVDELGETTNLAQYVMGLRRSLEEDELFHILRQVADPLDYAHTKKTGTKDFVHRCLKLNNILVGKGKLGVDIYLSDFGLSRIIGSGSVLTRTYKNVAEALGIGLNALVQKAGQDRYPNPPIEQQKLIPLHTSFLQNYAFLAPEQKRLDSVYSLNAKVDVYAFGVLVYFLLMKELPEGIFDMPSSRGQYLYQWDQLIKNCLQNNPAKRPDHLLSALESIRPEKISIIIEEPKMVVEQVQQKIAREETLEEMRVKLAVFDTHASAECLEGTSLVMQCVASSAREVGTKAVELETDHGVEMIQPSDSTLSISSVEKAKVIDNSPSLKPSLQMPQLERPQTDLDPGAIFQVNSSVKTYNPERRDVTNVKPLLTDMVIIPGGTFYRGSQDGNRDEMPRHQISLGSFAVDIHPVTNEQFVRFLEVMGGEKDSNHNDIIRLRDSRIKRSGGKLSIESGYTKHPVVGVTWYGAVSYAKWVGKRLPTEAEWEVAARGEQENNLYPTGDDIEKTQANFFSSDTTAVMSYAFNGFGLYDMAGNVYEWCHDWYGYNYYEISNQEPENPLGPLQGVYRVLRGGCWKSLKEDLRCSRRHRNNPGTVNGTYGFRCAAGVQNS